jgi:two-component system, OmpR family, response regulator
MRVLIGEHDGRMQTVVADALRRVGYSVDIARNGAELRSMVAAVNYALLILNAEEAGPALIRALRRDDFHALILVASGSAGCLIKMLDCGADDGLLKPFNNRELLARVRALLRRCPRGAKSVVCAGNIELEEAAGEVRCLGRPIPLRLGERQLLRILLDRSGSVVSKEALAQTLSRCPGEVSMNAIEAVVSRVRKRLAAVQSGIVILTERGIGYRLSISKRQVAPTMAFSCVVAARNPA